MTVCQLKGFRLKNIDKRFKSLNKYISKFKEIQYRVELRVTLTVCQLEGFRLLGSHTRQLAVSLFGNMVRKIRNTYEHQRVSDGKIQITILILRRGPTGEGPRGRLNLTHRGY